MTQEMHHKLDQTPGIGKDEIDLKEIFSVLWAGKWVLIIVTFLFAAGSVAFALSLSNVYTAEAKLAPSEDGQSGGLGGMTGQLGGLASLAGVRLPQGQIDKATLGMEIVRSRRFIASFINRHDIAPEVYAVDRWNGSIIFDDDLFDGSSREWRIDADSGESMQPSEWELVNEMRNMVDVSRDERTGFITLSVTHQSPELAQQWVEWLVRDVNNELRRQDVAEAERSIDYLREEIQSVTLSSMQQIFYQLIEKQTQTIMLANARPEYAFRIIDPAVIPERKSGPPRALICIAGTFLGGFLALLFVFGRYMVRSNIQRSTYSQGKYE